MSFYIRQTGKSMELAKPDSEIGKVQRKTICVSELAEMLSIGEKAVYNLVHSKDFYPAFKIGRKILINVDKLNRWIDEQGM